MRNSFYLPVLGARKRAELDIVSVGDLGDLGAVGILGDLVRFDAGPGLTGLPVGMSQKLEIPVQYTEAGGPTVDGVIAVTATQTRDGVELHLPGGRTVKDGAYLSPVSVDAQLDNPFSFPSLSLPSFSVDDSILVDIFNQQNPELLAAVTTAQARVSAAAADAEDAQERFLELEDAAFVLGEAFLAREAATAFRLIADQAEDVVTTAVNAVNTATDAVTDALFDFGIAQSALTAAQSAAGLASAAVASINAAITPLVGQASGFLDDLFGILSDFGIAPTRSFIESNLNTPIIGNLLRPIYDTLVSVEEDIAELREDLRGAEDTLEDALDDVAHALSDFNQADIDLQAAENALDDALAVDIEALEFAFNQADQIATQAENSADQLEKDVQDLGYGAPVKLGDLDDIALDVAEALAEFGLAEGALLLAEGELLAANTAYEAALALLPDVDFKISLSELSLGLDVQAGLEFNWNLATGETERDGIVSLLYDVDLILAVDASIELEGQAREIDIDETIEFSGRLPFEELGGRDLGDAPFGERLGSWADTFDFA